MKYTSIILALLLVGCGNGNSGGSDPSTIPTPAPVEEVPVDTMPVQPDPNCLSGKFDLAGTCIKAESLTPGALQVQE